MKTERITERILFTLLVLLALLILGGTVYALSTLPPASESEEAVPGRVYTSLGQIRAETRDGATVVLDIAFPLDESDRAFSEELNSRYSSFRNLAHDYLAGLDSRQMGGEAAIKDALLSAFNSNLRLGKISSLYFTNFLVLD
jgi:flagellar basal body-associated protein FliL